MSSLRKCSFNQNYTPNCRIEKMRAGSVCKIIPHCVTYRALKIPRLFQDLYHDPPHFIVHNATTYPGLFRALRR